MYVMDWMIVSCKNSHVEMLTLHVIVFRGGAFGRWLGCEGRALLTGISALRKEAQRAPFSTIWGHREKTGFVNQEVGALQTQILDFPVSRTVRNKCMQFKAPSMGFISTVIAADMD